MRFEGFMAGIRGFKNYSVVTELEQLSQNYTDKTAIICSSDYYALKVYFKYIRADVYGFDNIKMLKEFGLPITSVDYSVSDIAEKSIESIFSHNKADIMIPHLIK